MKNIDIKQWQSRIFELWDKKWFLLTAGNQSEFNTMTVSWGTSGIMWNKPIMQVVVRPQRFTYGFINRFDSFTLCAFPEEYRDDLRVLGSLSGRDGDKLAETCLHTCPSRVVAAPSFKEADLVIECHKIYEQDMDSNGFKSPDIQKCYPIDDYHRIYFGEVITILEK